MQQLAKREQHLGPPMRDGRGTIISCTLNIHREIRERPRSWLDASPFIEYEPTGISTGTFGAEIADCEMDAAELMASPVVFEWPDQRMFIAMQIVELRHEVSSLGVRAFVTGEVLGVARYHDGLTRIRGHQRLLESHP